MSASSRRKRKKTSFSHNMMLATSTIIVETSKLRKRNALKLREIQKQDEHFLKMYNTADAKWQYWCSYINNNFFTSKLDITISSCNCVHVTQTNPAVNFPVLNQVSSKLKAFVAVLTDKRMVFFMRKNVRLEISSRCEALVAGIAEKWPFAWLGVHGHVTAQTACIVETPPAYVALKCTESPAVPLAVHR